MILARTLLDGGQPAESVAGELVRWLDEARTSLDLALYDVRLPGAVGDSVGGCHPGRRGARQVIAPTRL